MRECSELMSYHLDGVVCKGMWILVAKRWLDLHVQSRLVHIGLDISH